MFEEMGLPKTTKRTPYEAQHIIPKNLDVILYYKNRYGHGRCLKWIFLRVPDADVSVTSRHKGYHAVYSNFVRENWMK